MRAIGTQESKVSTHESNRNTGTLQVQEEDRAFWTCAVCESSVGEVSFGVSIV